MHACRVVKYLSTSIQQISLNSGVQGIMDFPRSSLFFVSPVKILLYVQKLFSNGDASLCRRFALNEFF